MHVPATSPLVNGNSSALAVPKDAGAHDGKLQLPTTSPRQRQAAKSPREVATPLPSARSQITTSPSYTTSMLHEVRRAAARRLPTSRLHGRPTPHYACMAAPPHACMAAQDFPLVRAPRLPQALVASPLRQGRWEALRRVVDPRRPCLPAAWSMVCQGSRRSRCCSRGTLSVPQPRCADSLLLTQRALPCSASAARSTRGQRFKKSSTHCARVSQSSARRPCRQTACARELPTPQSMSRCRPRYAPSISAQASRGRRGGTSSASRHLRAT